MGKVQLVFLVNVLGREGITIYPEGGDCVFPSFRASLQGHGGVRANCPTGNGGIEGVLSARAGRGDWPASRLCATLWVLWSWRNVL